jgi:Protein of unknown function (DUF1681)
LIEVKPGEDIIYFVDSVIDSSRYYVIRLKDRMSTRSLLVGIGFRERDTSFDFKNCLNDYVRYVDRMSAAEKSKALWTEMNRELGGNGASASTVKSGADASPSPSASASSSGSLSQHRDLSIPAGQKITIKCKLLKNNDPKCEEQSSAPILIKPLARQPFLAPPPSVKTSSMSSTPPPLTVNNSAIIEDVKACSENGKERAKEGGEDKKKEEVEEDEEWGDFDSASIIS